MLSFAAFAIAVSVLFAGCSFLIAYVVEDTLFEDTIADEVSRQQDSLRRTGSFAPPTRDFISVHRRPDSFPSDLRQSFLEQGPQEEYTGLQGRHYHVVSFQGADRQTAFVVAEVSGHLAVRPLTGDLLVLIMLVSGAILLAALLLGYWLATRATAPLRRLVTSVSSAGTGEVPRIQASSFPANEVGLLATTLERMLDRTRAFVERETRFTRDASHELRTPLTIIRTSAELIENRGDVSPVLQDLVKRISHAAIQMQRAIDLLLLLAREERSQSPSGAVPLLPLIEQIVLAESARYGADAFDVRVVIAPEVCIWTNESIATAILSNLIGNVFKHTRPGVISIFDEGEDVVIKDAGDGMSADLLRDLSRDPEGAEAAQRTGFGLSIVTRLCRVHNIRLRVVSGPGGTTIRVGLVVLTMQQPPSRALPPR